MSHYAKTLTTPCSCANYADAMWFVANPTRTKYIREPYQCEVADNMQEEARAYISQVVCVWIDKSLNDYAEVQNMKRGIIEVKTTRRSFLFTGKAQPICHNDEDVERFMVFIDDSPDMLPSLALN